MYTWHYVIFKGDKFMINNKIINKQPILNYMKSQKLSKTAFCKLCKIGYTTLQKILDDNVLRMRIDKVFKIARVIKIHPKELFIH